MCVVDLKSQAKATETTPCFEMGILDFFRWSAKAQSKSYRSYRQF